MFAIFTKKSRLPPGFLLINKPVGWTSFDAVNFIRKQARAATGNKKIRVGHSGTLDPFATGLLIIGVGRAATKKLDEFKNLPKTYAATICLGATSDTHDVTGKITERVGAAPINKKIIQKTLKKFLGKQLQTPPMFSAKKVGGKKLYALARAGKIVERQPAPIEIYKLKTLEYCWPDLTVEVACSAGTYIRTLAHDLGETLGIGAYCTELTRTKIGPYLLKNAIALKNLDKLTQPH